VARSKAASSRILSRSVRMSFGSRTRPPPWEDSNGRVPTEGNRMRTAPGSRRVWTSRGGPLPAPAARWILCAAGVPPRTGMDRSQPTAATSKLPLGCARV
jgi:hypothetical protein